jgi:hypothetical protein
LAQFVTRADQLTQEFFILAQRGGSVFYVAAIRLPHKAIQIRHNPTRKTDNIPCGCTGINFNFKPLR